jgi:multimeric flavodoxin WrbA
MKVVIFNGSPRPQGNTAFALSLCAEELKNAGIETETIHMGHLPIRGCTACNGCAKNRDGKCVLPDDSVNGWIEKISRADGVILGAPVYYSSPAGAMRCFLDRAFYAAQNGGMLFRRKVGGALVSVRRIGGVAALDELNRYCLAGEMVLAPAAALPLIFGLRPGEAEGDEEGIQAARALARNMAWLIKLMEYGKGAVEEPPAEKRKYTNLIR